MSLEKIEVIVVEEDNGSQLHTLVQRLTGPGAQSASLALRLAMHPTAGQRDQRPDPGRNDRR